MTLTYISYEDQLAVMEGRMTIEEARRRGWSTRPPQTVATWIGQAAPTDPRERDQWDDGTVMREFHDGEWVVVAHIFKPRA